MPGYRKLGRPSAHRKSMLRNLTTDLFKYGRIETVREPHYIEGYLRLSAHGIDITQRIGRPDLSKQERIVHNRGEEIHRLDHGKLIADSVNSGIIGSINSNKQIIIIKLWQLTQNLGKGRRTYFRCSTRRLCIPGQSDITELIHAPPSFPPSLLPARDTGCRIQWIRYGQYPLSRPGLHIRFLTDITRQVPDKQYTR